MSLRGLFAAACTGLTLSLAWQAEAFQPVLRPRTTLWPSATKYPATKYLVARQAMGFNLDDQRERWIECGELANATYAYNGNPSKLVLNPTFDEKVVDQEIARIPTDFVRVACIFTDSDKTKGEAFGGYVAHKGDALYFCWRGTVFKKEWEADANVNKIAMKELTKTIQADTADQDEVELTYEAHEGMSTLYDTTTYRLAPAFSAGIDPVCFDRRKLRLRQFLEKAMVNLPGIKKIYVTGHSLGGALATLNAYHIIKLVEDDCRVPLDPNQVHVVTFSAPRVAGTRLARVFNERLVNNIRIQIDGDMVPQVPLYGGDKEKSEESEASNVGLVEMATWLGLKATDVLIGKVVPKGLGPGGQFNFLEVTELVVPYALKAVQSLLYDKTARFHHAGLGLNIPSTGLPSDIYNKAPWGLGMHHSLGLILYLLEGNNKPNRFEEAFLAEINKAKQSSVKRVQPKPQAPKPPTTPRVVASN